MEALARLKALLNIQMIKHTKRTMILALYPRHCPFCSKTLPSSIYICPTCHSNLPYVKEPFCYRCGKTVTYDEQEYCYDCRHYPKSFERGLSLFYYKKETKLIMANLKYHNKRVLADYITEEILYRHQNILLSWNINYIVPIPIHSNKRKQRHYNQAEVLAKSLSAKIGIPMIKDLLIRCIDTPPQKNFTAKSRYKNLSKAFSFNEKYMNLSIKNVLLIDDIYTTGATMEACSKILLSAGIQNVYIYSICIGLSRD